MTVLLVLGFAPVSAASANISHSYHTDTAMPSGSIVSLDPVHSGSVQVANTGNGSRLLGVTTPSTDSLLAVDASDGTTQVATSGTVNTLVSTLNGNIDVGDQVSVSPFDGIGMKATPGSYVIGLAQTTLNAKTPGATTKQVKNKQGQPTTNQISYVRLSIATGTANTTGTNLNSLQKLAQSLTGHTISTPRVVLSMAVALVALVSLIALIYASIYGSIISVGRNPLAKYTIFKTLGAVLAMAILTAGTAGLTIWLLLR